MLNNRLVVLNFCRAQSNFVSAAGFDKRTGERDYAKRLAIYEDKTRLNYAQLNEKIGCFTALLHSKYGLQKGDRLLARTSKSVDNLALYLATLRLGAIYVPLNPDYTMRETQHFVDDAEPKLMITLNFDADKSFESVVPRVVSETVIHQEASQCSPELEVENVQPDDLACMVYTSGTTGLPKGAMITHNGLKANAEALVEYWKFSSKDVLLHCLPFYHIHGMFISLNCTWMSRSSAIFLPRFDVKDILHHLPKSTVFMGVPTYYSRLLASNQLNAKMNNIRLFVSGSAPLSPSLWEEFFKRTGYRILERYGMTETIIITSNPYDPEVRKPGSVGLPIPGVQVRVAEGGMIEVKSPSLFKGYWRLPEKTKSEFTQDGYFVTGDMGEIDQQGYLHILGRGKDLIITGGLNVYPKQVEDVLDGIEFIKESAVIGVPHPDFGEAVVAVCVASNPCSDLVLLETEVLKEAKKELSGYKVPKKAIFVEELPRNSMGKIQKKDLREKYNRLFR